MLLLVFYNVRGERELMASLPERLGWLWFLGFDLDSEIPHHSVLSRARPGYQTHRAVDGAFGVITVAVIGPGDENKAHRLETLIDQIHACTGKRSSTVVADCKYGTTDNLLDCHRRGMKAHISVLKDRQKGSGRREGIFTEEAFSSYQPDRNVCICPAGEESKRRKHRLKRRAFEYAAPKQSMLWLLSLSPVHTLQNGWAYHQAP